jgi:hypothetical protein
MLYKLMPVYLKMMCIYLITGLQKEIKRGCLKSAFAAAAFLQRNPLDRLRINFPAKSQLKNCGCSSGQRLEGVVDINAAGKLTFETAPFKIINLSLHFLRLHQVK